MSKLHERHNITLDAKMLISDVFGGFANHGQTCSVYSMLLIDEHEESSSDIDQIPNIAGLDTRQHKAAMAAFRKIQKSQHWKKLTFGEKLSVIGECMCGDAKYLIREERHGKHIKAAARQVIGDLK